MRRNQSQKDSDRELFHLIVVGSDAATQILLNLNPSNMGSYSTRLLAQADTWAHYRVLGLKFRLHPTVLTNATVVAGYVGGVQDVPPANSNSLMEVIPSTVKGSQQSVPTSWVTVSRKDLAGPLPWYKSLLGGADATEESPGLIVLIHITSVEYFLEVFIEYEFKTAVATANSPAQLQLLRELVQSRRNQELVSERDRLLRVLAAKAEAQVSPTAK